MVNNLSIVLIVLKDDIFQEYGDGSVEHWWSTSCTAES